jgi:hypothetical protein
MHNSANFLELKLGIRTYDWAQKFSSNEQYEAIKLFLWHLQGLILEFTMVFWLYNLPINIVITNYRLARFLFFWPEVFLSTGIERLTMFLVPVAFFKGYWLYRWHRLDQCIFMLETKQNYFQARAIDEEREWVFFHLHDYDPVEGDGIYERYYRVCDGDESRVVVPWNHFSHQRNIDIYYSKNPFFKFFKWKFW